VTDRPDLPLFQWTPPKALLVFPADRWTGKARRTAEVILRKKTDRARQQYWDGIVERMLARLIAAGASEDDALAQIGPFRQAVQIEIDRLAERQEAQR